MCNYWRIIIIGVFCCILMCYLLSSRAYVYVHVYTHVTKIFCRIALDNISLVASVRAKPRMSEYFITHDPRKRNKLTELRLGDASWSLCFIKFVAWFVLKLKLNSSFFRATFAIILTMRVTLKLIYIFILYDINWYNLIA